MITEEQKIKIQRVILKTKGLAESTGYLPEVKFVETLEEAEQLAFAANARILLSNRIHSHGDRFDAKEFVSLFGQGARALDVAKTIDRVCKCGLGTVRVHIAMKGKVGARTNAIKIYVEVDWDHFDQQEYLFSCKNVLMAE
ncbi:hypothetical protein MOA67_gp347 [Klebsiella phage KpLz-2_45]|uniref:hypothetical protein n=1 Tax=Klebsiella phage KpLz-2_45 TaxID=2698923 RepID=UPI001F13EF71|nr:hypothetical protein MOA67_gp347 [Klebsiella phage KpLz-2_45]UKS72076.1 hypothetical protein KpLz245_2100 [Klebsiella phage KpLz-2_45]